MKRILLTLALLLTSVTLMAATDWITLTTTAAFPGRFQSAGTSDGIRMYIIGGLYASTPLDDVWSSTNGVDWTLETDAAEFGGRGNGNALYYDNKFWFIGGYDSVAHNDVWSSTDGKTWTEVIATAPWERLS